ncbi:tetraacyldisaccharide 4'-kinase [Kordia sp. YSTF-M3]|uniref:Tetraacyldisaccharide 4'-kinase n=1 Tax=Kordia aestuariivivens TaxID=2759037 RepID=A0ABR7Q4W1_9FLAO|nr:tetraacyldisaccharide 4'-kinase [Kordia aestuariivivens]MBC8753538.1 tetraacyldisaccharide 4'-kinase [Kordia aestuariivivens]
MRQLRFILLPFSLLYGAIVFVRNWMFTKGWLKSTSYSFPVICVGNLSVGGTGKSPMIEYLIRLTKDDYKVATLSRGYKRKTTGFLVANETTTASDIGDEPLQFYSKFKDEIVVSVETQRTVGIEALRNLANPPEVILLDDAFQHRKVTAGFNILLTPYHDLYVNDFMLPAGNLREPISGAKRADVIVVTKCPTEVSESKMLQIVQKLRPKANQAVFFTTIAYAETIQNETEKLPLISLKQQPFVLITGIANPTPLLRHLNDQGLSYVHLKYPDHHHFSESEINSIKQKAGSKRILTTEKDFMRLLGSLDALYYLPITVAFLAEEVSFQEKVKTFINKKGE